MTKSRLNMITQNPFAVGAETTTTNNYLSNLQIDRYNIMWDV